MPRVICSYRTMFSFLCGLLILMVALTPVVILLKDRILH
jgi:hypothetical protein